MLQFEMSNLCKSRGERLFAVATDKRIDATPLKFNRFSGRLPDLLLFYWHIFLHAIFVKDEKVLHLHMDFLLFISISDIL
jgi:hypothetical protein